VVFEDNLLFEKMAHFNREPIPECIVHAKGSTSDLAKGLKAALDTQRNHGEPSKNWPGKKMKLLWNIFLMGLTSLALNAHAGEPTPLRLVQTIPLPNVEGRIDHMAVDLKGQRLFIAALGNNSVEVLDLRAGKHLQSIAELHEPQGVAFIPEFNKIFIANGKNGACDILDGSSLKRIQSVKFSDDADNIRYDAVARRIYLGYGSGGLGIIDPANGKQIGDIKLDAHPESFQLERSGPRIFVNLPASQKIAVVNRETRKTVATWPAAGAAANFPMAFDETHHRLFVGFRKPAKLVVFDTETGKIVANLDSPGDADDIFYDEARARIYISGGEGLIAVVQQQDADHYKTVAKIPTAPGARTSLWVPEMNRLYLAVPHRGSQRAEVRVYEAQP
jgi:DNA-binding beta-propeller fold protein YncE